MKKNKTLWILLIVLVCLVGAYVLIKNMQENQTEEQEEAIVITEIEGLVKFSYQKGSSSMAFVKEDDIWYYEDDKNVALEQSTIESMASILGRIDAVREIEKPDALEDYGLENPLYTITLEDSDGTVTTLYIGNGADENYYLTLGEKEAVYTVGYTVVDTLEFDLASLLEVEEETETE